MKLLFILMSIFILMIPIIFISLGFFLTPNYETMQNQTMFLVDDDGSYADDYLRVITDLRFQHDANMTYDPALEDIFESGK